MARVFAFGYGLVAYLVFLASFLYAIAFVGNRLVEKTIDTGPAAPVGAALLINALLLGLFAIQYSVMARPGFKRAWTRIVPQLVERSTYVLLASLILFLLFLHWRPMPGTVWDLRGSFAGPLLDLVSLVGWGIVLVGTLLINHFDLFGLRQVYLYLKGREYTPLGFMQPAFYQYVRHPIMLGFIIAFWATAHMTVGHLVFGLATTGYILIAIRLEERDLVSTLGDQYVAYRRRVSMIVPGRRGD